MPALTLTEAMPRFCATEIAALMAVNSADPSVATVTAVGLDVAIAVTEVDVDDKEDEEAREAEVVEERVVDD